MVEQESNPYENYINSRRLNRRNSPLTLSDVWKATGRKSSLTPTYKVAFRMLMSNLGKKGETTISKEDFPIICSEMEKLAPHRKPIT